MKSDNFKLMLASTQLTFRAGLNPAPGPAYDHKAKAQWRDSASTWRHSSVSVAFGKADRFPKAKSNYTGEMQINFPSQLSTRSTSMGFGGRRPISPWRLKEAAGVPGPYHDLSKNISNPEKGRSFFAGR
jgi:hypothetical protein